MEFILLVVIFVVAILFSIFEFQKYKKLFKKHLTFYSKRDIIFM